MRFKTSIYREPSAVVRRCKRDDVLVCYLAEEADVESKGLSVSGTRIHVVPHQQHQPQEHAETFTFLDLFTGEGHVHDVRPDVVHLFLKRQLEEDTVQPGTQHLNGAHLKRAEEHILSSHNLMSM